MLLRRYNISILYRYTQKFSLIKYICQSFRKKEKILTLTNPDHCLQLLFRSTITIQRSLNFELYVKGKIKKREELSRKFYAGFLRHLSWSHGTILLFNIERKGMFRMKDIERTIYLERSREMERSRSRASNNKINSCTEE